MKKKLKSLLGVLLAVMTMFCLSISAFAAGNSSTLVTISTSEDYKAANAYYSGADVYDALNKPVDSKNKDSIALDKTYGVYTADLSDQGKIAIKYDTATLNSLTTSERQKATQEMASTVAAWGLSSQATNKIAKNLEVNADIPFSKADAVAALFNQGADVQGAMSWFAPFQGAVGIVLGVGVILIMVLLLASTVLDLVYIGIPTARMAMTAKKNKEGGEGTPFGISTDALRIVQDKEAGEGGNVYLRYFKSRILTYIILAVCILYLVSGQLGGLIGGLLDMVSGITG